MGSRLEGTLTTAATATVTITDSEFSTGATAAISHGSANVLTLAQVTINSSNATPIGGAGAGALDIGNIDFIQNSGIAGTVTQTYMRATDRHSPYTAGATGNFATIQAALDAANASGVDQTVFVQPGAYVEDLTLYDGVNIFGTSVLDTTITGAHTPPAAGTFSVWNVTLISATDIFTSAVAGTASVFVNSCLINITNGYVFDLVNWTGDLSIDNCGSAGTNDGVVNNTGGSTVRLLNATVGAGVGNALTLDDGALEIFGSVVQCPSALGGTTAIEIEGGTVVEGTITTAGTANGTIQNVSIVTGATAAISHGSAGTLGLSNCSISSSNNPAIAGAGAGVVNISGCEFADGSNLAATFC